MIRKYTILGLVQGIGYRPFVARIAEELNIAGWVRNTGGIVTVLASGSEASLDELYRRLSCDVPTGGFVSSIQVEEVEAASREEAGFRILESNQDEKTNLPLIPADIATCPECERELLDPSNRRYRHPFISCTICGPRYSIIEKLPYDRDTITMSDFDMCEKCKTEYTARDDRRRHAQTIACPKCGPILVFTGITAVSSKKESNKNAGNLANEFVHRKFTSNNSDKVTTVKNSKNTIENDNEHAIQKAVETLKNGGIVAVKDIGGYHLACNPFDQAAVAALRRLKHREEKAFAVMFENIEQLRKYCNVNNKEAEELLSPARPIVLVRRKFISSWEDNSSGRDKKETISKTDLSNIETTKSIAENVCLTSPDIGAMLPSNPVQILLVRECGPLIMTSGNASGDVLETEDSNMKMWLEERAASEEMAGVELAMLSHNRRILRPMDDSVMKIVRGRTQFIRRGRGHVPTPIDIENPEEIFAAGGDLKSSFCYVKNGLAYVSQYLGDLESVSCQKFYKNEMQAMKRIFGFNPKAVVADKHPGYFSRGVAENKAKEKEIPISHVQHHKAHVAAVIAEHNLKGPVLGFAFDGTGYGDDGTIWGSEVFKWDGSGSMDRVTHLKPMKLIGGDEGAKNCDTILVGMLHNYGIEIPEWIKKRTNSELICAAIDNGINVVTSTSMGRLFDAVSALLDICHYNSYEGQAPIELENIAAKSYEAEPNTDINNLGLITEDGDVTKLLKYIVNTISNGVRTPDDKAKDNKISSDITLDALKSQLAHLFINAVSEYVYTICKREKINQIVLSGGTFLNRILLEKTIDKLEGEGFKVYIPELLPPGDGGICLGQAYLLGHMKEEND
ncbi:carbamoyltransferase HypF [Pseudobutyrivibrio sp.]|uniref:carbamoyltransferase HypF n=1 Tax=Pseudobutyrivibrio sp. TaxID=2014367 RepID=UPI0025CD9639|nr:carbamoyltransferase HypF [Pseudobutyrivibrio sp.]MBR5648985.1 carbamoyltransferase HypF [Pseudobutyrivibrio sp.]